MDPSGHINFGVYNNNSYIITSPGTYNDGKYHQVVASLSSAGMVLYIDGQLIGTNTGTTVGQVYKGYWRIGGDSSWNGSNFFTGTIDEVAIYPTVLTLAQVRQQYFDSGRTIPGLTAPADAYGAKVWNDSPSFYYRMDESVGATTTTDLSGHLNNGIVSGGVTFGAPSTVSGATGTAASFDGSTGTIAANQQVQGPFVYTEEAWINTTSGAGGKIIGFGDQPSGNSGSYDRHVYMLANGKLVFGTYTGQLNLVTSSKSYNDGKWHYIAATQGPDGMSLYVDGQLIGTNPQTDAQHYSGYWRIGGDNLNGWGADGTYFNGEIDEAAVYSTELTLAQVRAHYQASPAATNAQPVASFSPSCLGVNCTFDSSATNDPDGTIASLAWTFGDGATSTSASPAHTYTASGSYVVTLVATDNQGAQSTATATVNVVLPPPAPTDSYGAAVYAANPELYWRLDETSGTTAADRSQVGDPGVYTGGVSLGSPSPISNSFGTGVTLDGNTGAIYSSQSMTTPNTFSESIWFNTTTTSGGKIIGFGSAPTGGSNNYDRHVYMLDGGQLVFGTWTGQTNTAQSGASYNDGKWHQLVATQGSDGMKLYVDGALVATNGNTGGDLYTGYLRVGGDNTWGGASSNYFNGEVDEVALFPTVLTPGQVQAQFAAAFPVANPAPVASFTATPTGASVAVDASASTDDGSIASYSWDFGDGTQGTGKTTSHTYGLTKSYVITLTVTDNLGATNTTTQTVAVTVPNAAPVASFTATPTGASVAVDASASTDDGSIAATRGTSVTGRRARV